METPCERDDECDVLGTACGADGVCVPAPREAGREWADDSLCTNEDACVAGSCQGIPVDCGDTLEPCHTRSCNPENGLCAPSARPDGEACDDTDMCTAIDECQSGVCVGKPIDCSSLDGMCRIGVCKPDTGGCELADRPNGTVCDDNNPCTDGETCALGTCGGATEVPDGSLCDDGDICSLSDQCLSGSCTGVAKDCSSWDVGACKVGVCDAEGQCQAQQVVGPECACFDQPDGVACDDADGCTIADACEDGACVGLQKDCSALDGDCNVGGCNPQLGECVPIPKLDGLECTDGSDCTTGDSCTFGNCAGTPIDCTALDGQCGLGTCEEGTGACIVTPVPDQTPCNDDNVCSGQDQCVSGQCTGAVSLCVCADKAAGDACDDGNPCTESSVCVEGEAMMVCSGTPKDCSALDGDCVLGVCEAETGECTSVQRPDGTMCDDADACSELDSCTAGACAGTAIEMCGGQPALCEAASGDDATPLAVSAETLTTFGWINPLAETDWYAVDLLEGQLLTVETRPHCNSPLDTQLLVYQPDGLTMQASDDDNGQGKWSKLQELEITQDGTWFVGVTAYETSGTGTYFLDVKAEFPPPCASNLDCEGGQMMCALAGPQAGQCVPAMATEAEPNDAAQDAMPMGVDMDVRGSIDGLDPAKCST